MTLHPEQIADDPLHARALLAADRLAHGEPMEREDWDALHAESEVWLREMDPIPEF
jgi:hypothetical protein